LDKELFNSILKSFLEFCITFQTILTEIFNHCTESMMKKALYNFNKEEKILFSKLVKEKTENFVFFSAIMFDVKKQNFKHVFDFLKRININQLDIFISQKNTKRSFELYLY
jgi:hypothetical protein